MAAISNEELRKKLETTKTGLANLRRPWETPNEEAARYTLRVLPPYVGRTSQVGSQNGSLSGQRTMRANNRLYNSTAGRALRTGTNGMSSGMSSPSQPWFKLKLQDKELMAFHEVKVWLDDVQNQLYDFLAQTNIYQAMQAGYKELMWSGSEAGLFVPDWKYGAVAYPLTWGEYWFGQDYGLRIDTLYRTTAMTVGQMKAKFGYDALSKAARRLFDSGNFHTSVEVMHAIEPNLEREYGKIDRTNKPYRSIYWEPGSDKAGILAFEGFDRKPFFTPRWESMGSDPYSAGPAFDALPDSRKLQLQELRFQQAQDYLVRPPLQMSVGDMNRGANLIPGGLTYTTTTDAGGRAGPIYEINAGALQWMARDMQERTEPAIREALFEPLFLAITRGMPGVQPRNVEEIVRRHEEQLGQLGPVVDRVQIEKLSVIVLQAFDILSKAQMLPPVPPSMNGKEIGLEFISILAQAQKMIGLGTMERALGFIGNIAGVYPQITDKPDFDMILDEYTNRLGAPARLMRSEDDVSAARDARAQQAAQQQQAAMMPAMAQGAEAARLLSETDVGGQPMLDRLMPRPGV